MFDFANLFLCLPRAILGLQMSSKHYISFSDGAYCSTQNLSSAAWEIYDPNGELVNLQGICLGQATNNIAEYSVVIKLLLGAIALGIRELIVKRDS